jgi:hypothetical protein
MSEFLQHEWYLRRTVFLIRCTHDAWGIPPYAPCTCPAHGVFWQLSHASSVRAATIHSIRPITISQTLRLPSQRSLLVVRSGTNAGGLRSIPLSDEIPGSHPVCFYDAGLDKEQYPSNGYVLTS